MSSKLWKWCPNEECGRKQVIFTPQLGTKINYVCQICKKKYTKEEVLNQ